MSRGFCGQCGGPYSDDVPCECQRRLWMYDYTLEELKELREEALEDYETAVDNWTLDDEEHERIEELKHGLEDIEEEIARRIGER